MTTYGVYTKDLSGKSLGGKWTVEEARKWCGDDGNHVVCSEKKENYAFSVTLIFYWCVKDWKFRWRRYSDREVQVGPLVVRWDILNYVWADKVVDEKGNPI